MLWYEKCNNFKMVSRNDIWNYYALIVHNDTINCRQGSAQLEILSQISCSRLHFADISFSIYCASLLRSQSFAAAVRTLFHVFHQHFSLISLMVSLVSFFTLSLVLFFVQLTYCPGASSGLVVPCLSLDDTLVFNYNNNNNNNGVLRNAGIRRNKTLGILDQLCRDGSNALKKSIINATKVQHSIYFINRYVQVRCHYQIAN